MQTSALFWDKMAEGYAKSPIADMPAYTYTLGRTRSYLSPTDQVLEVGCGTGSTALLLAGDVAHITATDSSAKMIEIARTKPEASSADNVTFLVAEATDTTIETGIGTGSFDAVLAHNLIHLLPDPATFIRAAAILVKPGGVFISKTVCNPGSNAPLKFKLIKAALPIAQFFGKAPAVTFLEIPELETLIQDAGFEIIESGNHPATPPNRYIVARKL